MKSIALCAALLFSAVAPLSTAVAAPAPVAAANQSVITYLGTVEIDGELYDVFLVESYGGGRVL
ncbi:MAG TPA: hypothetical protein VF645_09395 [Allosphingosinicella sp.]|jgi:hypothetical protein